MTEPRDPKKPIRFTVEQTQKALEETRQKELARRKLFEEQQKQFHDQERTSSQDDKHLPGE